MCGRTCLTLDPEQILCACKYKAKDPKQSNDSKNNEISKKPDVKSEPLQGLKEEVSEEVLVKPEWRSEFNCGRQYNCSYNIAPTDITPVLVSAKHFNAENNFEQERLVVPMMWGMIPFWHKGDYQKHGLTTNNCRLEHMLESKLYRGPFRRGQRCVVLCEGFYEWQTTVSAKPSDRAAYLIYMPQKEDVKIYDKSSWNPDNVNLLKMAGLYDVWEDQNGDKIYSYTVITFESSKIMSWLHHRMPAILETEEQVNTWLDYKHVSDAEALAALRPAKDLKWHRVSKLVNNSRNKSEQCNKPIELSSQKRPMNKIMEEWLNQRKCLEPTSSSSDDDGGNVRENRNRRLRPRRKKRKTQEESKILNTI